MTYAESVEKIKEVMVHLKEEAKKYGSSAFSTKVKYDMEELLRLHIQGEWALREEIKTALANCAEKIHAEWRAKAIDSIQKARERNLFSRVFRAIFKKF